MARVREFDSKLETLSRYLSKIDGGAPLRDAFDLRYVNRPISEPVLSSHSNKFDRAALEGFSNLLEYMEGDGGMEPILANISVIVKERDDDLEDEFYLQVVKQLSGNPSLRSSRRGVDVLCLYAISFTPKRRDMVEKHIAGLSIMQEYFARQAEFVRTRIVESPLRVPRIPLQKVVQNIRGLPVGNYMFYRPLEEIAKYQRSHWEELKAANEWLVDPEIPAVVSFVSFHLRQGDLLKKKGIFRVPPGHADLEDAADLCDIGAYDSVNLNSDLLSGLLKKWLRSIPLGLIGENFLGAMLSARSKEDLTEYIKGLRLPQPNHKILLSIIQLSKDVDKLSEYNRMTLKNLGSCLGISLFKVDSMEAAQRLEQIFPCLVENYKGT